MPLLKHFDNLNTGRFVTFTCYRRQKLLTAPSVICVFLHALDDARKKYHFRLYAYVIMPEHVHLVMHPLDGTLLGPLIGEIKSKSGAKIVADSLIQLPDNCSVERSGQTRWVFWQPRCYDHNCRTPETALEKINYCHNNPVKRGLVAEPGDWRWSSYNWYIGKRDVPIEIDEFEWIRRE
ncbi:MAG: transposase [Candidatus Zixiibacteriota bacterium]